MLDTVIVGGGVCGLALAHGLQLQGQQYALFEARTRLGGRVYSVQSEKHELAMDLGPTWFWPDTQPRITRLVAELSLNSFPQHDSGIVQGLRKAEGKPEQIGEDAVHNGAIRLEGGMVTLVQAFVDQLPADRLHLGHALMRVEDRGSFLALHFRCGETKTIIEARRVVLTIPPRLVEELIHFAPALDESLRTALRDTPTWMAGEAKALTSFDQPFWRAEGLSGNGFAQHEQAVLGELFDACDSTASKAAIGGFLALTPEYRNSFQAGMPMLIRSQLVQFYGPEGEHGELHYQDWATEPYTCSTLDRTQPLTSHPEYGNPTLSQSYWNNRLYFGASEAARFGGGYLEGALEVATRIRERLIQIPVYDTTPENYACLTRFSEWVDTKRIQALEDYRNRVQQRLAIQQREQLTQLSLLETMERMYQEALRFLDELPFDVSAVAVVKGRSELTPQILAPFAGFNDTLISEAVKFNNTSCAMSNFPYEHKPTPEYLQTIRNDLAAAWREFALNTNALVVGKSTATV